MNITHSCLHKTLKSQPASTSELLTTRSIFLFFLLCLFFALRYSETSDVSESSVSVKSGIYHQLMPDPTRYVFIYIALWQWMEQTALQNNEQKQKQKYGNTTDTDMQC